MVFGFILYETIDILYNITKLSYNGVYGIYSWYYDVNENENENEKILMLENRIKELEEKLN